MRNGRIAVLRGSGFIGRYIVQRLAERGYVIAVGCRHVDEAGLLRPMGAVGQVVPIQVPIGDEALLQAIDVGLSRDREARHKRSQLVELRQRYDTLTPRERQVLPYVVTGFANKQTAAALGIAEHTIGVHRGQIMRKMASRSLAELVRMADKLGIPPANSPE